MRVFFLFLLALVMTPVCFGQSFIYSSPVLYEFERRSLSDSLGAPMRATAFFSDSLGVDQGRFMYALPFHSVSQFNSKRPYGWGDMLMVPNVGFQQYISGGVAGGWKFLSFKLQPEFVLAQHKSYKGLTSDWSQQVYKDRFYTWGNGDYPERFSEGSYSKIWWGQSNAMLSFGAFQAGISTENIWWGPGQFNSLSFSNNAQGFPHATMRTRKPAKTFLGYFETELLIGQVASSQMDPAQNDSLNMLYAKPLPAGSRYLNALMASYQPKWIPNIRLGFARTFQVYDSLPRNTFLDWFPVFEPFQKSKFFDDGHSVVFDRNGRDQQLVIFGDLRFPRDQMEFYFEYGRRDHAYNWRDFILNPEHARAYMFGFLKLFNLPRNGYKIQLRGEVTQQGESINRVVRYLNPGGQNSWHEHYQARGFTNFGQGLGVGVGQGGNVQTFEISVVEGFNKIGVLLERVERDQGFYNRALMQNPEHSPWIDLSIGFLYDKKFDNLLLTSKLQIIHAKNYQWQLDPASTPEFPKGENLTSVLAQVSAIYFWNKKAD